MPLASTALAMDFDRKLAIDVRIYASEDSINILIAFGFLVTMSSNPYG